MTRKLLLVALTPLFALTAFSQISSNMNLLDRWDDNNLPVRFGNAYNDVWGYVDPAGNEYALVGAVDGIYIMDVTTYDNSEGGTAPAQVAYVVGGSSSLWRDMKTYQNFAYGVADEGSEGLIIMNLTNIPTTVTSTNNTTFFTRAHNIYIDEAAARLYVAGSNTHSSGLIVLDISNPASPVEIGDANLPAGYVHDVFVRGDTAYCSHGSNDGFYVYDYGPNADLPVYLGSLTSYPEQGYNHSSWLTADGDHLVFADETKGKGLKIADVSNLNAIAVSTSNVFRSTLEAPAATNSIAHNPFIIGDYVYISYYHDGVQIFDISNPNAVTPAGHWDTWPSNTDYSGWDGCWGVYPFLPSGNILASDGLNGLYVLQFVPAPPVPVELFDFLGFVEDKHHLLKWSTANESDSDFFEVERSRDGLNFEKIGSVKASGNSLDQQDYQLYDFEPMPENNYYRLRIVDNDESFEYSNILHLLRHETTGEIIRVYPNIINGPESIIINHDLSIEQKNSLEIRLLDMSGRVLLSNLPFSDGGAALHLELPYLSTGVYMLEIRGADTNYLERITVGR